MSQTQQPSHRAYITVGYGEDKSKTCWREVGALFEHKDQKGFTLLLDVMPINRRIAIRKALPKKQPKIAPEAE